MIRRAASWGTRPGRAVVALLAVALVACQGAPTPSEELEAAARATADSSVTFEFDAVGDPSALQELAGGAGELVRLVAGAGLRGARDPDGALRVGVDLGGEEPVLEAVALPDAGLRLRSGLAPLLGLEDGDPAAELEPRLAELGVDEAGRRALAVSFAGGWLELTDVEGFDEALEAVEPRAPREDAEPVTLAGVLAGVELTQARDAGDVRRMEGSLDLAALGPFAGEQAGRRPLEVVLREGRVRELRLGIDGDADTEPTVELVVRLTPVTDGTAVFRPEPDASLSAVELVELVEQLGPAAGTPPGGG